MGKQHFASFSSKENFNKTLRSRMIRRGGHREVFRFPHSHSLLNTPLLCATNSDFETLNNILGSISHIPYVDQVDLCAASFDFDILERVLESMSLVHDGLQLNLCAASFDFDTLERVLESMSLVHDGLQLDLDTVNCNCGTLECNLDSLSIVPCGHQLDLYAKRSRSAAKAALRLATIICVTASKAKQSARAMAKIVMKPRSGLLNANVYFRFAFFLMRKLFFKF